MSTSVDNDVRIARWNKYKSQLDAAGARVIRATQFLVRPLDGFPAYDVQEIKPLWDMWAEQKEIFWRMTSSDAFTPPVFPKMPAIDAEECCYRMWGLLIQVQIDGTHGSTNFLRETVLHIAANEKCKRHVPTCSCHVPDHPWKDKEDMEALAPINPSHRLDCNCGGWQRCKQKEAERAALDEKFSYSVKGFPSDFCKCDTQNASCICGKPEKSNVDKAMLLDASGNLTPEMGQALCGKGWTKPLRCEHGFTHCVVCPEPSVRNPPANYNYTHNVETCACGTCHKARVDSGTEEAYYKRCQDASAAMARLRPTPQVINVDSFAKKIFAGIEEGFKQKEAEKARAGVSQPSSFGGAITYAGFAVAKATAMSGGGPDKQDFAKNLFAAMGTPHDSKCPHGLPFYSCMPCSH